MVYTYACAAVVPNVHGAEVLLVERAEENRIRVGGPQVFADFLVAESFEAKKVGEEGHPFLPPVGLVLGDCPKVKTRVVEDLVDDLDEGHLVELT